MSADRKNYSVLSDVSTKVKLEVAWESAISILSISRDLLNKLVQILSYPLPRMRLQCLNELMCGVDLTFKYLMIDQRSQNSKQVRT